MKGLLAVGILILCGIPASAQTDAGTVVACETLVGLRLLMAEADRQAIVARLPQHPGCRTVARDRIGSAQSRAMVGGSPFECLAIRDEAACAWVLP